MVMLWYVGQYIKHLVFKMAKSGWNVVVSNHRGLGGISVTVSSFFPSFSFYIYVCVCVYLAGQKNIAYLSGAPKLCILFSGEVLDIASGSACTFH